LIGLRRKKAISQPEKIMPEMIDACTHGDTEIRDYLMKDLTELSAWFGVIFPAE